MTIDIERLVSQLEEQLDLLRNAADKSHGWSKTKENILVSFQVATANWLLNNGDAIINALKTKEQ